jgi:hypothetical protein
MVLARINFEGKTYDITTKADLNAVEKVMTLKRMEDAGIKNPIAEYNKNPYQAKINYGVDNLINKIHLLKDNIQLHPMLEKYNLMDYLFTQQLMCSTVGSHVAHPSKAKIKTPIVWAHPAIGKTALIDNGTYADKFMDWDVEFNGRRDAWIAQHSKTKIGTKAFKKVKTKY